MKNIKHYYKELGKIIYSIAIADGAVQLEERNKLHQLVIKELARNEKSYDSSGMNQAFYVDFEFDKAASDRLDQDGAIQKFTDFVSSNREPNDEMLIALSLNLMEEVANAYPKTKEKEIVKKIRSLIPC